MLKVRVIPTLLWKQLGLVKGKRFDSWRRVGTVLPAVRVYNTREVDELIVVDITASQTQSDPDYNEVQNFSGDCFVPLTVGGGIRSIEQIQKLLRAGADKVSINSSLYDNPKLLKEASEKFGRQCLIVSVDGKRHDNNHVCFSLSGKERKKQDVTSWCRQLEDLGAGEILLTSIDQDGTMEGYDLDMICKVSNAVSIPVIASGGAGEYLHMYQAIEAGASAVAAAAMFHYTEKTPLEAKKYLAQKGVPVRNVNQEVLP